MAPDTEKRITDWADTADRPLLRLVKVLDNSSAGRRLAEFCDLLKRCAPRIRQSGEDADDNPVPSIRLGKDQRIVFQVIPESAVLELFLQALDDPGDQSTGSDKWAQWKTRLSTPLSLKLYIGPGCPFCPGVLRQLLDLCASVPTIFLTVIDANLMADRAAEDGIKAVPTLVADDRMRWTGQVDVKEVLSFGTNRDPSCISARSLAQMLGAGEARQAAELMIAAGKPFDALVDLLTDPRWSIRLGAMVVVEYLAEDQRDIAAELIDPLWQRFENIDDQAKGDIMQVFGDIGTANAAAFLQQVVAGKFPADVKEAASEALEEIGNAC